MRDIKIAVIGNHAMDYRKTVLTVAPNCELVLLEDPAGIKFAEWLICNLMQERGASMWWMIDTLKRFKDDTFFAPASGGAYVGGWLVWWRTSVISVTCE